VLRTRAELASVLGTEPLGGFYTMSPDLLVALVRTLELQRDALNNGRDLFTGHGYYEFGMFRGFSFWFAEQVSRQYANGSLRFFGFDSFEGLPQATLKVEDSTFFVGQFRGSYEAVCENLKRWKTDLTKVSLFKGWYSDAFFHSLEKQNSFPPISICLIDVDLYDSCIPVLEFIRPHLVEGSILIFDDYNQLGYEDPTSGERRALLEFEHRYPTFRKEYLFNYGWEGIAYRVVSV
jgi:hypothetical protein